MTEIFATKLFFHQHFPWKLKRPEQIMCRIWSHIWTLTCKSICLFLGGKLWILWINLHWKACVFTVYHSKDITFDGKIPKWSGHTPLTTFPNFFEGSKSIIINILYKIAQGNLNYSVNYKWWCLIQISFNKKYKFYFYQIIYIVQTKPNFN